MTNGRQAKITIRMAPQLHDGLRASAQEAGCSLSSFILQVLAATAGHRARFRGITANEPRDRPARHEHVTARERWREYMHSRGYALAIVATIERAHGEQDPWFYVEWYARRRDQA